MIKTSFGKYFDDQRDRIVKDMQNKNAQQNIEWMEDYEKRQKEKKLLKEMMQEERLFWWEAIGT